ncbi:hypothetical protein [Sphingomonas sp. DT-204]|uniref:hypothetical protein n=1 Tax=Sphingomonas sp. DT-204 TaxID=3396166 RepID=UPI003F1E0203
MTSGREPLFRDKFTADPAPLVVGEEKVSYAIAPSLKGLWTYRGDLTDRQIQLHDSPGIAEFKGN